MNDNFALATFRATVVFALFLVTINCQADAPEPGTEFTDCDACPVMVVVPGGQFKMGSLEGEADRLEGPMHDVRIDYSFAVGKFEVTYAQFEAFVRESTHIPAELCIVFTDKWDAL